MKSVMGHQFSQVPEIHRPRSTFDRSHGYKTTFDAGYLIPFYADEALPGDTFNLRANLFARLLSPLNRPIMDNLFLDVHFFAVPNRILYENWERLQGQQDNPDDTTDYLVPQVAMPASTGATIGSLWDYLGIPTAAPDLLVDAWWSRAYNMIFNQWYRDQNLQDSVVVDLDDGPDTVTDYVLLRRGKRHDYFTSCLPWPQKGADVLLPLSGTAPVWGTQDTAIVDGSNQMKSPIFSVRLDRSSGAGTYVGQLRNQIASGSGYGDGFAVGAGDGGTYPGSGNAQDANDVVFLNEALSVAQRANAEAPFEAILSDSTAVTINQMREAITLQQLLEIDARGGTRYIEKVKALFGVVSPDERMQRPEYLGGSSTPVNINPVPSTAPFTSVPQATMAGYGTISVNGTGFSKSFTEHCVILGILSVRADLTYQTGLNRMFNRRTQYDFYVPPLANLGEQEVLNKELWAQGPASLNPSTGVAWDEEVFGYQERWAEYRYKPSLITGKLRSNASGTLDIWHLSQDLALGASNMPPPLNEEFIQEDPPVDRVIAAPSEPHFVLDSYIQLRCARPMPVYSVPGLQKL